MKKMKLLAVAGCLPALLLTSCEGLGKNSVSVERTPLSEVIAEAEAFVPGEYENLTFDQDVISVAVPENLSQCTLREVGCFDLDYGDTLLRYWVGDEDWDDGCVIPMEEDYAYAFCPQYEGTTEDGEELYAAVWCTGSVFYCRGDGFSHFFDETATRTYLVSRDDLSEEVELTDGTITLQEALDKIVDFKEAWLEQTDLQITLEPEYLWVCRDNDGSKFVKVIFQTCYNGVPISNVLEQYATGEVETPTEENGYTGDVEMLSMSATLSSVDGLDSFGSGYGSVELYDQGENCDSLLSLSDACDLLSKQLSGYGTQEIQMVQLEYRLTITGTDQPEDTYRFPGEDGTLLPDRAAGQLYRTSYDLYQAEPYWVFYAKAKWGKELLFMVDAINGDVRVIDNQTR